MQPAGGDAVDDAAGRMELRKLRLVHPFSSWRRRFNYLLIVLTMFNALIIPYASVFEPLYERDAFFATNLCIDVCFLLDIGISFRTAFFRDGVLVTETKQISRRYLRGLFVLDLFAAFPYDLVTRLALGRTIAILQGPKLLRLVRILQIVGTWERDIRINTSAVRLTKLSLSMLLIVHWVSCLWFWIASINGFSSNTWVFADSIDSMPPSSQYLRSLYWSLQTMTTVGYGGGVVPVSTLESLVALVVMIIGITIWSYIVGNLSSIIASQDAAAAGYRQKLATVNQYMQVRNLPTSLQKGVQHYFEYLWDRHHGLDESAILGELPKSLRMEVALYLNREVIKRVPLFEGADPVFISSLVTILKPQIYSPGDDIITRGEIGREMYFLLQGSVDIYADNDKLVATLGDGSFFGEIALLFNQKRVATVRAKTYCDVFMLERRGLEDLLSDNQQFAEDMRRVARKRYDVTTTK